MSGEATQIRQAHRFGYRSGEWADLLSESVHANGRPVYVVRFPDGATDFWVIGDEQAGYEFRAAAVSGGEQHG